MMGYYGNYGYGMGYGWGHVFQVIILVLVIAFFISLFVRNRKHGHGGHGCWGGVCSSCCSDKAIELLKERYVKGEIERAEFEQKKKDLLN